MTPFSCSGFAQDSSMVVEVALMTVRFKGLLGSATRCKNCRDLFLVKFKIASGQDSDIFQPNTQ